MDKFRDEVREAIDDRNNGRGDDYDYAESIDALMWWYAKKENGGFSMDALYEIVKEEEAKSFKD